MQVGYSPVPIQACPYNIWSNLQANSQRQHQDVCHHPIPDIQRPDLECSTGWRQFVLGSFPSSLHLHLILECKTAADIIGRVHGDGLMVCGTGIERDAEIPLPSITDRQAGSPCRFAGWSNLLCAFLYWPAALSAMPLDDDDDDEEDHLSRATQSTSPTLARCILSRILLPTVQGGEDSCLGSALHPARYSHPTSIGMHVYVMTGADIAPLPASIGNAASVSRATFSRICRALSKRWQFWRRETKNVLGILAASCYRMLVHFLAPELERPTLPVGTLPPTTSLSLSS